MDFATIQSSFSLGWSSWRSPAVGFSPFDVWPKASADKGPPWLLEGAHVARGLDEQTIRRLRRKDLCESKHMSQTDQMVIQQVRILKRNDRNLREP